MSLVSSNRPLKIGVGLPDSEGTMNGSSARWGDLLEMAQLAEHLGYDSIWNQEKPTSELRRELTERFPAPEEAPSGDAANVKRLWLQMKRLSAELRANKKIPRALVERAEALAGDLEEVVTQKAEA